MDLCIIWSIRDKGGRMVKRLLLWFTFLIALMLVGCSFNFGDSGVEEKEVSAVQTSDETEVNDDEVIEEEETEETTEIDKELVDSKHLKAKMNDIVKVTNDRWDEERYEINFELENKHDETIVVTAEQVSADDVMIDKMVFFSETIASSKKAHGKMVIENYDGPLPEMEKNLEFILHIYSPDNFDFSEDHEIKIEF